MIRDGMVTRPLFPKRFRTSSILLGGIGLEVRAPSRLESDWEILGGFPEVERVASVIGLESGRTVDVEVWSLLTVPASLASM